jgi:hypothetical protein
VASLRGGGAAKESGRFEDRWTVNQLFHVLDESASVIELEPPGMKRGFEFSLQRPNGREWHQVKHEIRDGKWSLYSLDNEEVLRYFKEKLESEAEAFCHFFSSYPAVPLGPLCSRSRVSETFERFKDHFLANYGNEFADLCKRWGGIDGEAAWELLKRTFTRHMDEPGLIQSNLDRATSLVESDGDSAAVVRKLTELAAESIHQRLDAQRIWKALEEEGWGPSRWSTDPAVLEAIQAVTAQFLGREEELLINHDFSAVEEVDEIKEALFLPAPASPVVVHGPPGCGKSTTVTKVIKDFLIANWSVLTLDLRRAGEIETTEELGEKMGLPGAPADVLGGVVKDRRALLVIDGLDRVGAMTASPQGLADVVFQILETANSHDRLSVLVTCRTTELEHDVRVQAAISPLESEIKVRLDRWAEASVEAALVKAGIDRANLDEEQFELLRIPQNLFLLINSKDAGPFDFRTSNDLSDRYTTSNRVGP